MISARIYQQRELLREKLAEPADHLLASDLICAASDLARAWLVEKAKLAEIRKLARRAQRRGWSERQIAVFAGVSNIAVHLWKKRCD